MTSKPIRFKDSTKKSNKVISYTVNSITSEIEIKHYNGRASQTIILSTPLDIFNYIYSLKHQETFSKDIVDQVTIALWEEALSISYLDTETCTTIHLAKPSEVALKDLETLKLVYTTETLRVEITKHEPSMFKYGFKITTNNNDVIYDCTSKDRAELSTIFSIMKGKYKLDNDLLDAIAFDMGYLTKIILSLIVVDAQEERKDNTVTFTLNPKKGGKITVTRLYGSEFDKNKTNYCGQARFTAPSGMGYTTHLVTQKDSSEFQAKIAYMSVLFQGRMVDEWLSQAEQDTLESFFQNHFPFTLEQP